MPAIFICAASFAVFLQILAAQDIEKVEVPDGSTRCMYGEPCGHKKCFCCGDCDQGSHVCQVSETRFCADEPWAAVMELKARARKVRGLF